MKTFPSTSSSGSRWQTQQLRDATVCGEGSRFLIRDNDDEFGTSFDDVATGPAIKILPTPIRTRDRQASPLSCLTSESLLFGCNCTCAQSLKLRQSPPQKRPSALAAAPSASQNPFALASAQPCPPDDVSQGGAG